MMTLRPRSRRPLVCALAVTVLSPLPLVLTSSAAAATPTTFSSLKVNFQPESAPRVSGYAVDGGRSFDAVRGYGWLTASGGQPYGLVSETRDRNRVADQRYDTLIQTQADATSVKWEANVPAGTYRVTVAVGDPLYFDSTHRVQVEGVTVLSGFRGTSTAPSKTVTTTSVVSDGRLTVDTLGGSRTKLHFVELVSQDAASLPAPSASPSASASPISSPSPTTSPIASTSPSPTTSPSPSTSTGLFTARLDPAAGTTGWGLETSGTGEQIRLANGRAECTAGGYPASTHYARLRRKLPETDDFAATKAFTITADFELPADFYDRHQSYLRFFNTDNYPGTMRSSGTKVGAVNADEWRLGFLVFGSDRLPRLESEHQNNGKVSLWRGSSPLPVGRHQVEVRFTPSRTTTGSWELILDGTRVGGASGVQTVPSTVGAAEMAVTRVVGCIDGAADQDSRTVQVNLNGLVFSAVR